LKCDVDMNVIRDIEDIRIILRCWTIFSGIFMTDRLDIGLDMMIWYDMIIDMMDR
jgi:hypothetical protein